MFHLFAYIQATAVNGSFVAAITVMVAFGVLTAFSRRRALTAGDRG